MFKDDSCNVADRSTTSSNLESTAETTPIHSLSAPTTSTTPLEDSSRPTLLEPGLDPRFLQLNLYAPGLERGDEYCLTDQIPAETPRFLQPHPRKASKDGRVKWKKLASIPADDIPLWFDKQLTIWTTSNFRFHCTCQ
ncbi:hypothetical protein FRC02_001309 [Tulasnella sp. 418]|nr:hypothetical protein FRC02_001309 [Tulasnella sp. 418]